MDRNLGQRTRLLILLVEVLILVGASRLALGRWLPSSDNQGFWFYTALLGLILSRRLDTPSIPHPRT